MIVCNNVKYRVLIRQACPTEPARGGKVGCSKSKSWGKTYSRQLDEQEQGLLKRAHMEHIVLLFFIKMLFITVVVPGPGNSSLWCPTDFLKETAKSIPPTQFANNSVLARLSP